MLHRAQEDWGARAVLAQVAQHGHLAAPMDVSGLLQKYGGRLPKPLRNMLYPAIFGLAASPAGGALVILTNVAERLRGPHALRPPPASLTPEDLDAVSYESIDMLNAIPREATHKGYAVIGGSGYVGTCVRLT